MRVVLYDEHAERLSFLRTRVRDYFSIKNIKTNITCFSSQNVFLDAMEECFYNIAIINIYSQGKEKNHIVEQLKTKYPGTIIIFIGKTYKYVHKMFSYNTLNYLRLPIRVKELYITLDRVLDAICKQNDRIVIPTRESHYKRVFHVDDIKFIETYYNDLEMTTIRNEHIFLHVKNRTILRDELIPRYFLKINQSMVVNMHCIDFLTTQNVILKTREVFPLSQTLLFQCHKSFDEFIKKKVMTNDENSYLSEGRQLQNL